MSVRSRLWVAVQRNNNPTCTSCHPTRGVSPLNLCPPSCCAGLRSSSPRQYPLVSFSLQSAASLESKTHCPRPLRADNTRTLNFESRHSSSRGTQQPSIYSFALPTHYFPRLKPLADTSVFLAISHQHEATLHRLPCRRPIHR